MTLLVAQAGRMITPATRHTDDLVVPCGGQ